MGLWGPKVEGIMLTPQMPKQAAPGLLPKTKIAREK